MSGTTIAIFRLPTARATEVGHVRVVRDRHGGMYVEGSKVVDAAPSGDFLLLTLASGQVYFVKASDYTHLQAPPPHAPRRSRGR